MALRLKIVSDNAAMAGEHARWTFGVNGGRIGRHTTNDWVLRDPERYVSGRHAEIEHRGGAWLLRDTSTNGTFVNASDEALGPDRPHELSNGDRFRIGEYEIEVEITGGNDFPAQESAPVSQSDLDSSFEVKNFISTGRREREAQAARIRPEAPPRPVAVPQVPPPTPPQPHVPRGCVTTRTCGPGSPRSAGAPGSIRSRCPPRCAARRCSKRGQLLRETFVGFSELARTRADFASEFGNLLRSPPQGRHQLVHAARGGRTSSRNGACGSRARRLARNRRDPRPVPARPKSRNCDGGGAARSARGRVRET
jgi:pSer/pThr/pTyr-binding forkhead associated (FHA) protein